MEDVKRIVNFFFEAGTLRKIARAHRQPLMEDDISDNIASHSFRVAVIGFCLAKMEGVDANKVMTMGLFHDLSETRGNDHNWIHKRYVKIHENEIFEEQIKSLPIISKDLSPIMEEYEKRESREAKIAKDADILDQMLLISEYRLKGNKEAERWMKRKLERNERETCFSESAKKLYDEIAVQSPSDWWSNLWTSDNRKA